MSAHTQVQRTSERYDAARVLTWWTQLVPDATTKRRGDPGALADLRRCSRANDVQLLPVFETLVRACGAAPAQEIDLAVVAAVLAHARENDASGSVPQQLAAPKEGGAPTLSPARFRRLLQTRGPEERISEGVRLVKLLRGRVNVRDLAEAMFWWDHSDGIQRQWAREYYARVPEEFLK